ncbi:MAG: ClbS/DfsB family four-helix bundle protein [Chloroflexota bacterium]
MEEPITTKTELLADIDRDWTALHDRLDQLTETEMTTLTNADGWTVKDHIAHLTAWERSVIFMLQGKPRHAGLGVPEAVYLSESYDAMNEIIFQEQKDQPLTAVLARFQQTHQELLDLLHPLSDADLQKPYHHYLPDEPGKEDGPPVINFVYGNTAHHFKEHLRWIEELVGNRDWGAGNRDWGAGNRDWGMGNGE